MTQMKKDNQESPEMKMQFTRLFSLCFAGHCVRCAGCLLTRYEKMVIYLISIKQKTVHLFTKLNKEGY